jgi:hypothetical protein
LSTFGVGGGDISVYGKDITLALGGVVRTGIAEGAGSLVAQSGDMVMDATGTIKLSDGSNIGSFVSGTGNGGMWL